MTPLEIGNLGGTDAVVGGMKNDTYTYEIEFCDGQSFPWHWKVRKNGGKILNYPTLGYTGIASTGWGARWAARRYIKRHRRHDGKRYTA
jgi:hypothetical protein